MPAAVFGVNSDLFLLEKSQNRSKYIVQIKMRGNNAGKIF